MLVDLDLGASFDSLQDLWELLPLLHDLNAIALLLENLDHLLHFLFAVLQLVDTNVANAGDAGTHGSSCTRLAVLDGDGIFWLHTKLLTCVEVDLRVRLAGWWVERSGSAVDVLVGEVVVDLGLLKRSNNTWFGRCADDRHGVSRLVQALELFWGTGAWLALGSEFGSDSTDFLADVLFELILRHGEVVLLLETDHHATEVLADEGFQEVIDSVALLDVVLLEDLIGEISACFESETL